MLEGDPPSPKRAEEHSERRKGAARVLPKRRVLTGMQEETPGTLWLGLPTSDHVISRGETELSAAASMGESLKPLPLPAGRIGGLEARSLKSVGGPESVYADKGRSRVRNGNVTSVRVETKLSQ